MRIACLAAQQCCLKVCPQYLRPRLQSWCLHAPQIVMTPPGNVKISHWTHAGGFLAGLCMAYIFLPNIKDNKWRQVKRRKKRMANGELPQQWLDRNSEAYQSFWTKHNWLYLSIIGFAVSTTLVIFVAFPIYVYTTKLSGLVC